MRLGALVATALSSAAAVDYYGGSHTFCAAGSGCDAVRHSGIGQSLGQALPAIGMIGFALIVLLSLSRQDGARMVALVGALTGGMAALLLLGLQALSIGAFCGLCVGADAAALLAAAAALPQLRKRAPVGPVGTPLTRAATRAALVLALGAPIALALSIPRAVPGYVRELGQADKLNVIEFSDFECPYCRALHPHLKQALEPYGERVHFVRRSFPLPSHENARHATRAYLCAIAQGEGEAMAHRLFGGALDPATNRAVALELGLDAARYDACIGAAATDKRIDADMEAIRGADFHGLPTVWIGDRVLEGFNVNAGGAPYADALERAARGQATAFGWRPWLVLLCAVLLAAVPALAWREPQAA